MLQAHNSSASSVHYQLPRPTQTGPEVIPVASRTCTQTLSPRGSSSTPPAVRPYAASPPPPTPGSMLEGGGQILRYSAALSAITGRALQAGGGWVVPGLAVGG